MRAAQTTAARTRSSSSSSNNQLIYSITHTGAVSVLVSTPSVTVTLNEGKISAQVNLLWNSDGNSASIGQYELVFVADVPALGLATYTIT